MRDSSNWTLGLGRLAGVPVRLHVSVIVGVLFAVYIGGRASPDHDYAGYGLLAGLVWFGSLVVHQMGHLIAAGRIGAHGADEADRKSEAVQLACEIERRAADAAGVGEDVEKDLPHRQDRAVRPRLGLSFPIVGCHARMVALPAVPSRSRQGVKSRSAAEAA